MMVFPTILVTRPEPGLSETMKAVQERGWRAVACPVMTIQPSSPLPQLPGRALAITSAQALPALLHQPRERLLITVGEKTAWKARQQGFLQVEAAGGDRASLETLCRQKGLVREALTLACGRGWRGQQYSFDVAKSLGASWVEAYHVKRHRTFPLDAEAALERGVVEAVLFFSSENVALFMECLSPSVYSRIRHVRALCASEAIAEVARERGEWKEVVIAHPVEALGTRSRSH